MTFYGYWEAIVRVAGESRGTTLGYQALLNGRKSLKPNLGCTFVSPCQQISACLQRLKAEQELKSPRSPACFGIQPFASRGASLGWKDGLLPKPSAPGTF
jgi:hypothetical protein